MSVVFSEHTNLTVMYRMGPRGGKGWPWSIAITSPIRLGTVETKGSVVRKKSTCLGTSHMSVSGEGRGGSVWPQTYHLAHQAWHHYLVCLFLRLCLHTTGPPSPPLQKQVLIPCDECWKGPTYLQTWAAFFKPPLSWSLCVYCPSDNRCGQYEGMCKVIYSFTFTG